MQISSFEGYIRIPRLNPLETTNEKSCVCVCRGRGVQILNALSITLVNR